MKKSALLSMLLIGLLCLSMFAAVLSDTVLAIVPLAKPPPSNPSIAVEKYVWDGSAWVEADYAPGPPLLASAGSVRFNVTVTNKGNVALSKVTLTDTAYSSSPVKIGSLAVGASYKISYSLAWSSGSHSYTASVQGVYKGKTYSASDSAYYFGFVPNPNIKIVKTANLALAQIGETVTYTFVVTNPGNVPLSSVSVNDNVTGVATYQSGDTNTNGILENIETWIFTDNCTVAASPDPLVNNATVTGYYGATMVKATDSYSLDVTVHGPMPFTLAPPMLQINATESMGSQFGFSVAIGNGIIAVGAMDDYDWWNGPYDIGHVYVYNATTLELIATLTSPNYEDSGYFGYTVVISGGYLLVGAMGEDGGGELGCEYGAAYVYSLADLNAAPLELTSPTPTVEGEFGIALATDGTNVYVGADAENVGAIDGAGAVHIFALSNGSYIGTLNQTIPEDAAHYGTEIVVYDTKLYISAPQARDRVQTAYSTGAVYVYDLETRTLLATLASPMPRIRGNFGNSLAVVGGYIIVGADHEDDWLAGGPSEGGLVHIFDATTYENVTMIKSPNQRQQGYFGEELATDGTYLVISAAGEGTPGGSGKAYVYALSSLFATPIILTSPNAEYSSEFGAYGAVGISNGVVVIGASDEFDSGYGQVGHVYIYSLEAGEAFPEYLTSPNGGWSFFGLSLAVGDGYIVVGAPYENIGGDDSVGRVYVYNATDGTLAYMLDSQNQTYYGWFGWSVAIGDGIIVVGAPQEPSGGYDEAGNAYVYNATNGAFIDALTSDNPGAYGNFGFSVGAGAGVIVVGAPGEWSGFYPEAGRVYIYNVADRTPATFSPLNTPNPIDLGRFGFSVAVGEGFIVVGAAYEEVNGTEGAGRVYVYSAATGALANTLASPNPAGAGFFGRSVAVGDDVIVVGAPEETAGGYYGAGNVYVYDITNMTTPTTLSSVNPQENGRFGLSVAVGDGLIVVGAPDETSGGYAQAGNAYVYNVADMTTLGTLTTPNPGSYDETGVHFGDSVAVGEAIIAVGSTGENYSGGTGVVYLYQLDLA